MELWEQEVSEATAKDSSLGKWKDDCWSFLFFSSSPHSPSSSVLISLNSQSRKFQLGTSSNLADSGDGMSHCFHVETSQIKLSSDCDTTVTRV